MTNTTVFRGVKWTVISTLCSAIFSIVKIYFLTYFLNKSDFGLMAIITFITSFFGLLIDFGLSASIFHVPKITVRQSSTLFWLNFILGVFFTFLVCSCSSLIADFYSIKLLKQVVIVASVVFIISALGKQQLAMDQKNMNFKRIEVLAIFSSFAALLISIILASKGFGVWSLVIASITAALLNYGTYFFIGVFISKNIRFSFSLTDSKYFIKVGGYSLLAKSIGTFSKDMDLLFIGKIFGLNSLGLYSLAKELAQKPLLFSGPIIKKVFTPYLAINHHNTSKLKSNYLNLIKINSFFTIVVTTVFILFADVIVAYLYGEKYLQVANLARLLGVFLLLRTINSPVMALLTAKGRTDYDFQWNLLLVLLIPIFLFSGSSFGLEGIALSFILMRVILIYPSWYFFGRRLVGVTFNEQLKGNFILDYKLVIQILKKTLLK